MSFSSEQKAEILACELKNPCCKRAFIQGVLAAKGGVADGLVSVSVDSSDTAEFICETVNELYDKDPTISTGERGGRRRIVCFGSKSAEKLISSFRIDFEPIQKCASCQGAFLRGLFLAVGRVCDPMKQYCLEFSSSADATESLSGYFASLGLTPRISEKKNETVIYFKKSSDIEDFFALAGMNQAVFALMNAKIQGDMRNTANRIANCETNNIDKAVSASMEQIVLLEELSKRGLLSQLPEDLEYTARMRMEHKDLSLSRLAAIITPPISKPGLSHRLKKITEYAKNLIGDVTK